MFLILLKFLLLPFASVNIILNSYRRELVNLGSNPWQIGFLPILLTHPIFFILLLLTNNFHLPTNPVFYSTFLIGCSLYLLFSYFTYLGISKSHFGLSNTIIATAVVWQSICAVIFLHETFTPIQWGCFIVIGLLTFDLNFRNKSLGLDQGIILVSIGVLISAVLVTNYKYSSTLTHSYFEFLSGRIFVDFFFYLSALLVFLFFNRSKGPTESLKILVNSRIGITYMVIQSINTTAGSIFYFYLPASQIALISTLVTPLSFLISRFRYKEPISREVLIKSALIIISIGIFLFFKN